MLTALHTLDHNFAALVFKTWYFLVENVVTERRIKLTVCLFVTLWAAAFGSRKNWQL